MLNLEEAAIQELKLMSQEELDLVQYENVWWMCCCKGCNNAHRMRDYGIAPEYWSKRWKFTNVVERIFFCEKHWKLHKRIVPLYGIEKFALRFIDYSKPIIITNEEKIKLKNKRT